MGKNCFMCEKKIGFGSVKISGKDLKKGAELMEYSNEIINQMNDKDVLCGDCNSTQSLRHALQIYNFYKEKKSEKDFNSFKKNLPKVAKEAERLILIQRNKDLAKSNPILPKGIELKSEEGSKPSNSNSTSSDDTTKTLSPIGKRDISTNTSEPDMSRLMIPSNLLPENYEFDPDMMDTIEFEYGNGNNFKSTTMFKQLPVLADGEEILWSYIGEQGVFNKKARIVMALTNFRAFVYVFDEYDAGFLLTGAIHDVVVMNSHRQSSSHRMGSFHSNGRMGMRIGTHSSISSSRSQTVGDVHFMHDGETLITFGNVSDPHGIAKLSKSIQKQITIRDKIDETKPLMENTYVDNRTLLKISELYHQGNEQEAVKMCDNALKLHPDDEGIFKIKLAHCVDTGNWKQMVVDSRNMLLLKDHEPAFEYLMMGLIKLDKTNDAIDELHRGLELFPENAMLLDFKKQLDDFEANNLLDNKKCPKCNKENESDSKFCNKCGAKFDEGCKECGKVNPKNSKFCNDCGASLV